MIDKYTTPEEKIKQEEWQQVIEDILHVHSNWSQAACDRVITHSKFKETAKDILDNMKELMEALAVGLGLNPYTLKETTEDKTK